MTPARRISPHRPPPQAFGSQVLNAALVLAVLGAFYSGFRMPSLWSINYFIPGIFDGFTRRTLLGTLLSIAGEWRFDYFFVATVQALVLLAMLAVVVAYTWKSDWRVKAVAILFFVGPAGGYLFHEVGYVDQVLYLLLFAALAAGASGGLALMVAALFVHEMAAFTVVPIWLAWLFAGEQRYRTAVIHGVVLVAAFGVIYAFCQTTPAADIERLMQKIAARATYAVRTDYYDVFRHALNGPDPKNHFSIASIFELVCAFALAAAVAAPFVVRRDAFKAVAVGGAALTPLLLGFIGWDSNRWIFLAIASGTLLLVLFADQQSPRTLGAGLTVLTAFGIVGFLVYFDDYQPRRLTPWPHLLEFVQSDFPSEFGRIPKQ